MTSGKIEQQSCDLGDMERWTFDRFITGSLIGSTLIELSPEMIRLWKLIYGSDHLKDGMPRGLAQVIIMSAYTQAVKPRPPGNLHIGQYIKMHSVPKVGEQMSCEVVCVDKFKKKGMSIVIFEVDVAMMSTNALLFTGRLTISWAG